MMESQDRTKVWFIVALCLLVLIGGYFFANWLIGKEAFRGAAPVQPPVPLIAPAAQPTIKKFKEVAEYTQGKPLPSEPKAEVFLTPLESDEHVLGDRTKPVAVVLYAPLTSIYTQLLYPEMVDFLEKNKEEMYWVFRHYPGTNNENDYRSAIATECITEQLGNDGFWRYLGVLMQDIGGTYPLDTLVKRGVDIGADGDRLKTCIEEQAFYDNVLLDKQNAQFDAEIYVTPTFVFQNMRTYKKRIAEGLNTMEYMQAVLDEVLKRPGQAAPAFLEEGQ